MIKKLTFLNSLFFVGFSFAAQEATQPQYPVMPQKVYYAFTQEKPAQYNLHTIKTYLDKDPRNIEATDHNGSFPLLLAIWKRGLPVFDLVMKYNPQVNRTLQFGGSPLEGAICEESPDKVSRLLAASANKRIPVLWLEGKEENWPLHDHVFVNGTALDYAKSRLKDAEKWAKLYGTSDRLATVKKCQQIVQSLL